ncbi:hypothetical protein [Proteus vulgaris]|uniref:hypothetical protein n=2 Tax=Proteus TaxID=583 RepID=UPI0034D70015
MSLKNSARKFTITLRKAIETASYKDKEYDDGLKAKEALIRSQSLIGIFHEWLKCELDKEIKLHNNLNHFNWNIHPAIGTSSPELTLFGFFKKKAQDIVFIRDKFKQEKIASLGEIDKVGYLASNTSITCGVRSQMSSIDKNFDTLMERAIAEAVNLKVRLNKITLGELYIIPIREIDNNAAKKNIFKLSDKKVKIDKFIRQFYNASRHNSKNEVYMVDAACLLIIDLENNGNVITQKKDLKNLGFDDEVCEMFEQLKPTNFIERLLNHYINNNQL